MLGAEKALLLVGSPRKRSVSRMLGEHLLAGLAARGWESETLVLTGLLETQEGRARLSGEFLGADLAILASPVYVDALPAQATRALEFLAGDKTSPGTTGAEAPSPPGGRPRRFAAVFTCGFPESSHADISLDICRLFAREAGLDWAGGIGIGGAGALDPSGLARRSKKAANVAQALDMAAAALAKGGRVPPEALELAAMPLIPRWLYLLVAEGSFLSQALKHKTLFRLGDRPFRKS